MELTARELLVHLYQTALDAVDGRQLVQRWCLDHNRTQFTVCIAIGKAAPAMLQGALDSNTIKEALLICPKGYVDRRLKRDKRVQVCEASHPVPDQSSIDAGHALIHFLARIPEHADCLVLISGGTSSLVEVPADTVSLDQCQAINEYLLASGKNIDAINAWRKKFSRIKGGGLLNHVQHIHCTQLLLSDVENDDVAVIGSGLLISNHQDVDDDAWLHEQCKNVHVEQVSEHAIESVVIGNLAMAKAAVAAEVQHLGLNDYVYSTFIKGEAAEQAVILVKSLHDAPVGVHIWGGETTVTLPDKPGLGGRNQTFALSAARYIDTHDDLAILAAGTDGIDGNTPCAGAIVTSATLPAVRQTGFDADAELAKANAGVVLMATGDLLKTGPSNTNVMDLIIAYKRG